MSTRKKTLVTARGFALATGCTLLNEGVNFSIFARHAHTVTLIVDLPATTTTKHEQHSIPLHPHDNKTGDIWHILIKTRRKDLRYGYRINGPHDHENNGLAYNEAILLLDPVCPAHVPRAWGHPFSNPNAPRCTLIQHDFDWQGDRSLNIPLAQSIIYELHVRGFTQHQSSGVSYPGSYAGVMEKIPYLKTLGITAVELMPVTEFDENDTVFTHPRTGERLKNFWGYNPISFFALKSGYAADPAHHINEFKTMVRALHQAGIEVILDMVFNHSGEGGYNGTTSSFRGIDNRIYYLLDRQTREYLNFSGCGNTMNCNHPVVRELIKDALHYWVIEMHIDGFRFDLASILGRDSTGHLLANPPMIEMIAEDPVLRDTKIIAEAWDAGGLYQVGSFSTDARWAEWNGKFRDDVRAFMAGHEGTVANLATRMSGSSDLYQSSFRHPYNSINFITSHDGFTLADLVSYNEKHNLDNGEENRDGENHNLSWNSGVEGPTRRRAITALRHRRMRSMMVILLLSQGVPMLASGDEFGHSKGGNNNSWCQDNETNWLNWDLLQTNKDLFRFVQQCIHLRKKHPLFQRTSFFPHTSPHESQEKSAHIPEIIWQSLTPGQEDWSAGCHTLAFLLAGNGGHTSKEQSHHQRRDYFFLMLNGSRQENAVFLPPDIPETGNDLTWRRIIDTSLDAPYNFFTLSHAPSLLPGSQVTVKAMGVTVLQAAPREVS